MNIARLIAALCLSTAVVVGCAGGPDDPAPVGSGSADLSAATCHFPVTCEDGTKGCADKTDPCSKHGGECSAQGDKCVTEHDCCSGSCDNDGAKPSFTCVAACKNKVTCSDGTTGCADSSDPCAKHGGECSARGEGCANEHDCCPGLACDNDSAKPTFNCVAR